MNKVIYEWCPTRALVESGKGVLIWDFKEFRYLPKEEREALFDSWDYYVNGWGPKAKRVKVKDRPAGEEGQNYWRETNWPQDYVQRTITASYGDRVADDLRNKPYKEKLRVMRERVRATPQAYRHTGRVTITLMDNHKVKIQVWQPCAFFLDYGKPWGVRDQDLFFSLIIDGENRTAYQHISGPGGTMVINVTNNNDTEIYNEVLDNEPVYFCSNSSLYFSLGSLPDTGEYKGASQLLNVVKSHLWGADTVKNYLRRKHPRGDTLLNIITYNRIRDWDLYDLWVKQSHYPYGMIGNKQKLQRLYREFLKDPDSFDMLDYMNSEYKKKYMTALTSKAVRPYIRIVKPKTIEELLLAWSLFIAFDDMNVARFYYRLAIIEGAVHITPNRWERGTYTDLPNVLNMAGLLEMVCAKLDCKEYEINKSLTSPLHGLAWYKRLNHKEYSKIGILEHKILRVIIDIGLSTFKDTLAGYEWCVGHRFEVERFTLDTMQRCHNLYYAIQREYNRLYSRLAEEQLMIPVGVTMKDTELGEYKLTWVRHMNELGPLGTLYHNCVATYMKKVVKGESYIANLTKDGKPHACCEYSTCSKGMVQVLGVHDRRLDKSVYKLLGDMMVEDPTIRKTKEQLDIANGKVKLLADVPMDNWDEQLPF